MYSTHFSYIIDIVTCVRIAMAVFTIYYVLMCSSDCPAEWTRKIAIVSSRFFVFVCKCDEISLNVACCCTEA